MNWSDRIKACCGLVLIGLCAACAGKVNPVNTDVPIAFPPGDPITSVEQADRVLEAVSLSKAQIDWRYRQKEQDCYGRFFVNSCLLDAKGERRTDSARVKKIEVEANYFKRRDNVEQMDRALVERNLANPLPASAPGADARPEPDSGAPAAIPGKMND